MIKSNWKIILAFVWLILTHALAGWWMYFILKIIDKGVLPEDVARYRSMLKWEGLAWMVLLFVGGFTLVYFIFREKQQSQRMKEFFAVFSHDLKTSLASLRLQAESLIEDGNNNLVLQRLVGDTGRLQLQLENSLYLAKNKNTGLYLEKLSLSKLLLSISHQWPQVDVKLSTEAYLVADQRALESVFKNLIQNSVVHGKAHLIEIELRYSSQSCIIKVTDDGEGFTGQSNQLGKLFTRHQATSGTGMGLHIVKQHLKEMEGGLKIIPVAKGFCVELEIPKKELP